MARSVGRRVACAVACTVWAHTHALAHTHTPWLLAAYTFDDAPEAAQTNDALVPHGAGFARTYLRAGDGPHQDTLACGAVNGTDVDVLMSALSFELYVASEAWLGPDAGGALNSSTAVVHVRDATRDVMLVLTPSAWSQDAWVSLESIGGHTLVGPVPIALDTWSTVAALCDGVTGTRA